MMNGLSRNRRSQCTGRLLFLLAAATCLLWPALGRGQSAKPGEAGWISLFNGKDLSGWTPKIKGYALGENFGDTFRVEDGVIKVSYDQYQKVRPQVRPPFLQGQVLALSAAGRISVRRRAVPGGRRLGDAQQRGMLHCQPPETMAKDQDFPVSIEVQFLGGRARAASDGQSVHAGHARGDERQAHQAALHQLQIARPSTATSG